MATPLPELLTILAEHAPKLRKAGILALELEHAGVKVQLAPDEPDVPKDLLAELEKRTGGGKGTSSNPLFDATTYGLEPGSKLPGFDPPDDDDNAEDVDEHGRPLGADLDED